MQGTVRNPFCSSHLFLVSSTGSDEKICSKSSVDPYRLAECIAALTPPTGLSGSSAPDLTNSRCGKSYLVDCFALRCFQHLSQPDIATQHLLLAEQPVHQRSVHPGPLEIG